MRTLKDVTKEEIIFFDLKLESCMKLMGENLNEVLEYCRRNDMEDVFGNYVELAFANLVHKVVSKESVNLFLNKVIQAYCVGQASANIVEQAECKTPTYIG